MKIWMVFQCADYYPSGGEGDFVGASLESEDDAMDKARKSEWFKEYDCHTAVFNTETLKFE